MTESPYKSPQSSVEIRVGCLLLFWIAHSARVPPLGCGTDGKMIYNSDHRSPYSPWEENSHGCLSALYGKNSLVDESTPGDSLSLSSLVGSCARWKYDGEVSWKSK